METIGKVLSLTLLTIFGSAAATVYFVDSDFFEVFIEEKSGESQSEKDRDQQKYSNQLFDSSEQSERIRIEYFEQEPLIKMEPANQAKKQMIWSQSFNKNQNSNIYISKSLAQTNTLNELRNKMKFWQSQYKQFKTSGINYSREQAYNKYVQYREAVALKEQSGSY